MVKNIIESVLKKDPVSTHDHVKKEMSKRIHESLDKKLAFESKDNLAPTRLETLVDSSEDWHWMNIYNNGKLVWQGSSDGLSGWYGKGSFPDFKNIMKIGDVAKEVLGRSAKKVPVYKLNNDLRTVKSDKPRQYVNENYVNENYEIEMTSNYSVYEDKMGNFTLINEKSRNKEEVYLQGDDAHEFRKELEKVKNERQFDDLISQYEDVME